MSFTTLKFGTFQAMTHYLNGGIVGGVDVTKGTNGLPGKTLTFTNPAFSVTFANAVGGSGDLRFDDIKTQLEAASNKIKVVLSYQGQLAIVELVPTIGVSLDPAANEAARTILGFAKTGACAGRVVRQMYSPTPPRIENVLQSIDGAYVLMIWEGNH